MKDVIEFVLSHPGMSICLLALNSVALMMGGIWLGRVSKSFVTWEAFGKAQDDANRIHDDMAHRYQRTMEDTATRMKEILTEKGGQISKFLMGASEDMIVVKKRGERIEKDMNKVKTALQVAFPQTKDIFRE